MKQIRLRDLADVTEGHILQEVLPGEYISTGGLAFCKPGSRSHTNNGPDGRDCHVHTDGEAFMILQGHGEMEVDGVKHPVRTGDVILIEPGEDHHLISSSDEPIVTVWCHARSVRNPNQE